MAAYEPAGAFAAADAALVERVRAGEAEAFHELFRRYHRLVYGIAHRLLNDPADADDVCQEVFLAVHRRLGSLRDPEKLRSWLCRITLTRAYNVERSFRRRFRTLTISIDPAVETLRTQLPMSDPERALVSSETRRRLEEAIASLPFANRTVVILRDVEGLSYDEIAEAADVNIGTVKSRLARGREALRKQLGDLVRWQREVIP